MQTPHRSNAPQDGAPLQFIAPVALAVLFVAVVIVIVGSVGGDDGGGAATKTTAKAARKLPVYWTVKPGETYAQIAEKTGLTIDQLETFNPRVDPNSLLPGSKLKLTLNVPKPKPKRKGPKYYRARPGDSYGLIAAKFHRDITKLQKLNPDIKATEIQPGDRIQLRD